MYHQTNATKEVCMLYHKNKYNKGSISTLSPKQMQQRKYFYSITKINAIKEASLLYQQNKYNK
jgi:hypothetical protein